MTTTRREILLSTGALAGASMLPLPAAPLTSTIQEPAGVAGSLSDALNVWDVKALARKRLSGPTWDYINGAAADEISLRWNRESYDRIRLRPSVLVDATRIDTRTRLFGQDIPFPILLSPTGSHRASHREGELATAKGAGAAGAIMVVSTMANTAVEDIASVATQSLWFQLYILRDRTFTRDLVQRAEDAGCKALCVTVDTAVNGARNRQTRARFTLPAGVGRPHLEGLQTPQTVEGPMYSRARDPNVTWKDIDWLRSFSRVPILLKGVLNPADADRAVQEGVSGILVSNHGARNLDTVPATVDALPEIVDKVGGRVPILIDGGIRRGTDVLKALALGANAVLMGRPYVYGLGAAGAEGVERVVNILRTELVMAMGLTGRTTIDSIDRSVLWSPPATLR